MLEIKSRFEFREYRGYIISHEDGSLYGYIAVPDTNIFYGMNHEDYPPLMVWGVVLSGYRMFEPAISRYMFGINFTDNNDVSIKTLETIIRVVMSYIDDRNKTVKQDKNAKEKIDEIINMGDKRCIFKQKEIMN